MRTLIGNHTIQSSPSTSELLHRIVEVMENQTIQQRSLAAD